MTETGCAALIREYWKARGYDVNVRLETVRSLGHVGTYVRSDLINGLPPGYRDRTAGIAMGVNAA